MNRTNRGKEEKKNNNNNELILKKVGLCYVVKKKWQF